MKNFYVGQHGSFSDEKFKKDYRDYIAGFEVCQFGSDEDFTKLNSELRDKNLNFGIHFPLRTGLHKIRDPLFMDLDKDVRLEAFSIIEDEVSFIHKQKLQPEYLLFHYPKPVVIPVDFDMPRWRFYFREEYVFEKDYPKDVFVENTVALIKWLEALEKKSGIRPVLELDALNRYILNDNFLEKVLDEHKSIKLCIDIGRLHVQDKITPGFNGKDLLHRFLKYTSNLHLWNAKVGKIVEHAHFPLLPELKPEDGWADVEGYFDIIRQEKPDLKILFEHRSDLITDLQLDSCYHWIKSLC